MHNVIVTEAFKEYYRSKGPAYGIRVHAAEGHRVPKEPMGMLVTVVKDKDLFNKLSKSYHTEVPTEIGPVFFDPEIDYWKREVTLDCRQFLCFRFPFADGVFVRTNWSALPRNQY